MTQPLDHPILVNEPTGGGVDAVHEEKYVQMIDVAWMNSEKMKWIGWDKQGYYAWITPKGMIYLFKDLKRNEKGKEWEKEHGTMRLPDDGRTQSFWPTGRDFYEWEKEVQENCGFCNDSRATPTTESDKDEEGGSDIESDSEGLDLPAWKNLLDGGGLESRKKVTDTDDVSYTGFATDTSKIGYETYGAPYANGNDVDPSEYIGNHDASEYIDSNEYIGAYAPQPTSTQPPPAYTPPPRKQNPVVNTQKILTAPKSPFQKIMVERRKQFEESAMTEFKWDGSPKIEKRTPASVGTYGVTPTVLNKFPDKKRYQTLLDGSGEVQNQQYTIEIPATRIEYEHFKNSFMKNPGTITTNRWAEYNLIDVDKNELNVGDIIRIDIFGPFNGDVEVLDTKVDSNSFQATFQTLKGHPEAGSITFTGKYENGIFKFNINNTTRQSLPFEYVGRTIQEWQWIIVMKNISKFFKNNPTKADKTVRHFDWDKKNNKPGKNTSSLMTDLLKKISQ